MNNEYRIMKFSYPQRPYQSPAWEEGCRFCFVSLRRRFESRRRSFDPSVGFDVRRVLGFSAAFRMRATRRSMASWRFISWVRNRRAPIMSDPSAAIRLPAREISRSRTYSGRDGDLRTSKRSCAAVATLLTFCPPGPDARTNSKRISSSFSVIFLDMWSMPSGITPLLNLPVIFLPVS